MFRIFFKNNAFTNFTKCKAFFFSVFMINNFDGKYVESVSVCIGPTLPKVKTTTKGRSKSYFNCNNMTCLFSSVNSESLDHQPSKNWTTLQSCLRLSSYLVRFEFEYSWQLCRHVGNLIVQTLVYVGLAVADLSECPSVWERWWVRSLEEMN